MRIDGQKSWSEILEESADLSKKNAGLRADKFRIHRMAVNVLNNLEKIVPIEPRAEYHVDAAMDEVMKIVNVCMPTGDIRPDDVPY
jgi:hypothetical protein